MNDITIPPEAVEAGAKATLEELDAIAGFIGATRVDGELTPEQWEFFRRIARAANLAALSAWPGMLTTEAYSQELNRTCIILPLTTQEPGDE